MVEFVLTAVLVVFLLLAVLQVAIYMHERNIIAASAAEGARYGAYADVANPGRGAIKAHELIQAGLSRSVSQSVQCGGTIELGDADLQLVRVRCTGTLPLVIGALGHFLVVDVSGRALLEK